MKSRLYWELLDYGTFVEDEGGFYASMINILMVKFMLYYSHLNPKENQNNNGRQVINQWEQQVHFVMVGQSPI